MLCHRSSITTGPLRRIFNRRNASHIFAMKTGHVQSFFYNTSLKAYLVVKCVWSDNTHIFHSACKHNKGSMVAHGCFTAKKYRVLPKSPKAVSASVSTDGRLLSVCVSFATDWQAVQDVTRFSRGTSCLDVILNHAGTLKRFFFFYQYYSPESLLTILHCGAYQKQA